MKSSLNPAISKNASEVIRDAMRLHKYYRQKIEQFQATLKRVGKALLAIEMAGIFESQSISAKK
ncbi:MAG: hypothetical protein R2728_02375 [Chitinophagales bacterium]